ncbi:MAG TPA: DUF1588 domain-containing protein [Myxococcota bacterium]
MCRLTTLVALVSASWLAVSACQPSTTRTPRNADDGAVGEGEGEGEDGGGDEGEGEGEAGDDCDVVAPALTVFAERCIGCHDGSTFPDLRADAIASLHETASLTRPESMLIVPGSPDDSFLFKKMSGTQGDDGGALMPLGAATPIDEVGIIRTWIAAGAPTTCDDVVIEPPAYDPNSLDQQALFQCSGEPSSSPARLRRVQQLELQHAVGRTGSFSSRRSQIANNPFTQVPGKPYTTYPDDVSVDAATLDLFLLQLPKINANWTSRDHNDGFGERMQRIYDGADVRCIFSGVTPTEPCIDTYLDVFLRQGLLFRDATDDERAHLRAFLIEALAEEAGDASKRKDTLYLVGQAAWLTSGALFRRELGDENVDVDDAGRRPLRADELALALSQLLSTHPVGSSLAGTAVVAGDPDWEQPFDGFFGAIARARDDGSLDADADAVDVTIGALLRERLTGVEASRPDLAFDGNTRPPRGEYFVASRVRDFFREYLGVTEIGAVFKDTPAATTAFHGQYTGNPMFDPTTIAFTNLQQGFHGRESTFAQQLDDTIARLIVEADDGGDDFFHALLTSRTWRLPSNLAGTNDDVCTSNADCTDTVFRVCITRVGRCGSSTASSQLNFNRIFSTGDIANTHEARWVTLPEDERGGVLTHPAWLSTHGAAFEDDASLVHRGKWIRENLLCQTVPGLENVQVEAQLGPTAPDLPARERVRRATETGPASTTCLGCHRLMNPLGNAFELYNHAGILRVDDHGHAPDGSTVLDNAPDETLNRSYATPMELSAALATSAHARRCFVRHTFRFFAGRDETLADGCTLTQMEDAFAGGSFNEMLIAFAQSDAFRYRHVDTATDTTTGGDR